MPPAAEGLPTGHGNDGRPRPSRRQSRRPRKIDFGLLDGLSTRADAELRETEDALIGFIEQQSKRDALYARYDDDLRERFQFGRMGGIA
jgi:hypothetical protein